MEPVIIPLLVFFSVLMFMLPKEFYLKTKNALLAFVDIRKDDRVQSRGQASRNSLVEKIMTLSRRFYFVLPRPLRLVRKAHVESMVRLSGLNQGTGVEEITGLRYLYFSIRKSPEDGSGGAGETLGKPVLTAPDSPVSSAFNVITRWEKVANATGNTKYVINVLKTETGESIVSEAKASALSYSIESGLLSAGIQYTITVSAIDPDLNASERSEPRYFTTIAPTPLVSNPTPKPTVKPTETPKPTVAPTPKPTAAPTQKPTAAPTPTQSPLSIKTPKDDECFNPGNKVKISWNSLGKGTSYRVIVRDMSYGSDSPAVYVVDTRVSSEKYTVSKLEAGRQYKIAICANPDGTPVWASNVKFFSVRLTRDDGSGCEGLQLGKPVFITPKDNEQLPKKNFDIKWQAGAYATKSTKYKISVYNTSTGKYIENDKIINKTTYRLRSKDLEDGNKYRVTVCAIDPNRERSDLSTINFEILAPTPTQKPDDHSNSKRKGRQR